MQTLALAKIDNPATAIVVHQDCPGCLNLEKLRRPEGSYFTPEAYVVFLLSLWETHNNLYHGEAHVVPTLLDPRLAPNYATLLAAARGTNGHMFADLQTVPRPEQLTELCSL